MLVVAVILVVVGLFVLAVLVETRDVLWHGLWRYARRHKYVNTKGVVIGSESHEEPDRDRLLPGAMEYQAIVAYGFTVGGEDKVGKRLRLVEFEGSSGKTRAEETLARYPLGSAVTVYYDPDDPNDCSLSLYGAGDTIGWGLLVILWLGLGLSSAGWGLALLAKRF